LIEDAKKRGVQKNMTELSLSAKYKLNNGIRMPALGLGVYQMTDQEVEQAIKTALDIGYRHFDTAAFYKNEQAVGKVIRESGIPREEIFVTTKLWPTDYLFAEKAFERSLKNLDIDYIDLYLLHWPTPGKNRAWKSLERMYASERVKAIGVSNYSIKQLEELQKKSEILPAVNQVEFSPFLYQKELLVYCKEKGIQLEAYSPLTRGKKLNDNIIQEIANKYKKTPAQIMIRWSLEHGNAVIPKSSNPIRIAENANVFDFDLSSEDMLRIDGRNENYSALFKR
jgi:diketogulonate reductase-like aldo/keto reductase